MNTALVLSLVGLVLSLAATAWTIAAQLQVLRHLKNLKLEITARDGRLLGMIDLETIDTEDPRSLETALENVENEKKEVRPN